MCLFTKIDIKIINIIVKNTIYIDKLKYKTIKVIKGRSIKIGHNNFILCLTNFLYKLS